MVVTLGKMVKLEVEVAVGEVWELVVAMKVGELVVAAAIAAGGVDMKVLLILS